MANIISYATGNLTGTTTFKNAATGTNAHKWVQTTTNVTSTTTSDVYNGNTEDFTITNLEVIEGVLLFCKRLTTTGTVTVTLSDDSGTTATRTVTVNASDLPTEYSPVFFQFGTTLTADGGTDYAVAIKGSSSANASFVRASSTAADWAHSFRTNTTSTPAAADNIWIVGQWTGAGASSAYTVTMNDTASTDWGTITIGDNGTLTSGTTAATNYTLKHSGDLNVWGNGTYSIGTTGTPIPRGSTYTQTMDCTTNVEFGMIIQNGGTFNSQGLSRTSGKDIFYCKLNTDEAVNSTSLGVDTDTGWLDNDEIAVASTTRTASQCEAGALNGNAGASSLTVDGFAGAGGGLAFAHDGTSPVQAEVILLTRSIKIQGASASLQGYVELGGNSGATVTVDIDWTEFKWLGSATNAKRGIDNFSGASASVNIQYSSLHDFSVASSIGLNSTATTVSGLVFSNNVTWNIANIHFNMSSSTSGTWTADSNIFMRNTDSANLVSLFDIGGTFTNNTIVGGASRGLSFSETTGTPGTFSGCTIHSCASDGLIFAANTVGVVLSTFSIWRNNSFGINFSGSVHGCTFTSFTLFGNLTANIASNTGSNSCTFLRWISLVSNGDTTFSTTSGISTSSTGVGFNHWIIESADFSTVSGIKTAHTNDINISGSASCSIVLRNSKMGGTNEVATQTNMAGDSYIGSQKHDQTAGLHKTWKKYGTITIETTTTQSGTTSFKMTPNNASNKLESGSFYIPVANGATLTPSVYVYEDASYNGARARLILKRNDAIGITSDTVIDTATASSDEAWEALTGTTAAATDDGVMEFVIDCDGTAGNLFVDTFTTT